MRLGMLHLFENPVGKTEHQIVKEQTELMIEAERLGFDSVWPAEHHFSEYGWCASPQVTLASIASRTERIRLGTGIVVLPFHNPVRVAEDFAFLDLLSDGRVDFGIGRGYQPTEYAGFGLDQTRSREMFDESIRVIQACWTEDRVNFHGEFYDVDNIEVRPKPLQKPHPPIYMACLSPETFEMAGRYGFNLLMGFAFGLSRAGARTGIESYKRGREQAGLDPEGGQKTCLFQIYCADTMEAAHKEFADPLTWYYRTIAKYIAPPTGHVASYELYSKTRELASNVTFDQLLEGDGLICGDAEHCTEKLTSIADEYGFDELLCWTRVGGLETPKVLRAMELLSGEVMPAVRKEANR
jgi:natural product biosynthesis luciferase-like monooxygenase protein